MSSEEIDKMLKRSGQSAKGLHIPQSAMNSLPMFNEFDVCDDETKNFLKGKKGMPGMALQVQMLLTQKKVLAELKKINEAVDQVNEALDYLCKES